MSASRKRDVPDWMKEALADLGPATTVDAPASATSHRTHAAWPLLLDGAVAGAFLPWMLGQNVVSPELREEAERDLLGFAHTVQTPEGVRWMLTPEARADVLNDAAPGDVAAAIERTRTHFTDAFSEALRRCLEKPLGESDLPRDLDRLEATRKAVASLSGVKTLVSLPRVEELDRRVQLARLLAQFSRMIGETPDHPGESRFFGRDAQLKTLRDYCAGVEAESFGEQVTRLTTRATNVFKGIQAHIVWGVGGVGKTTLVAKFMLEHARAADAQFPFAYLDFDRSTINASHLTPLLGEMCGQVAVQFPREIGAQLEDLRVRVRELAAKTEPLSSLETLSLLRSYAQEFRRHVDGLLEERERLYAPRPFLLVFDTFEVVQYESVLVEHLEGFVALFNDANQRPWRRLKLIIAGRQRVPSFAGTVEDVQLGPLDRKGSVEMLMALAGDSKAPLSEADAASLVESIARQLSGKPQEGVHPLQMHLVGTIIEQTKKEQERKGEPFSIQPLLRELGETNAAGVSGRTFINGVLVRRILGHVVDSRVRALADPGLVVRRITEEVIRLVMAPSTNTPAPDGGTDDGDEDVTNPWTLTKEEAKDIYGAFRREVTLVEFDDDNALRHRPDIRQEMLPLIRVRRPRRFADMHRRAFEYFDAEAKSNPDDDKAAAEAIYHGLWASQPLQHLHELWRTDPHFAPRIDAAEFDAGSPAHVFVRAKAGAELTVDEVRLLPRAMTLDWLTRRAELLLEVERVDLEIMSVIRSAAGQNFEDLRDRPALAATVARMLYRSGDWQDAMLLLSRALDRPDEWSALASSQAAPELWSQLRTYVTVIAKSGRGERMLDAHADALAAAPEPLVRLEFIVHRALAAARAGGTAQAARWRREVRECVAQVPREEWRRGLRVLRLAMLLIGDDSALLTLYAQSLDRLPRDRALGAALSKVVEPLLREEDRVLVQRLLSNRAVDARTFDQIDGLWRGAARQSFADLGVASRLAFLQLLAEDHQEWVRPLGNALTGELAGTLGPELLKWLSSSGFEHGPLSSAALDGVSYAQTAYDAGKLRELAEGLQSFGSRHQSVSNLLGGEYPRNVFEIAEAFLACRVAILERWTTEMSGESGRDWRVADAYGSVPFEMVLRVELEQLQQRRRLALERHEQSRELQVPDESAVAEAHRVKPFGLAFSGGGIRSATFNLGIIQGLAEHDLLRRVDYLSTVSGGGYIGSWLHGFIKHHCDGDLRKATRELSPTDTPVPRAPQEDPISFLRKYSNYLAPRPGLFSADTWVIGSIWLRNVLLNQLILLPAIASVVLAAFLFYFVQMMPMREVIGRPFPDWLMPMVAVGALAISARIAWHNLAAIVARCWPDAAAMPPASDWWERRGPWVLPLLIFGAAVALACGDTGARLEAAEGDLVQVLLVLFLAFYGLYLLLQFRGGFLRQYRHVHDDKLSKQLLGRFHPFWMSAVSAGLLVWLIHVIWLSSAAWDPWTRVTVGPPLVSLALMASVSLLIGLMGADYPDGAREWIARSGALLALVSAAWLVLFGMVFFGPYAVAWGLGTYGKTTLAALAAWIATGGAGVMAGSSARTDGVQKDKPSGTSKALGMLVNVAPTLVMLAYLLLVVLGAHQALVAVVGTPLRPAAAPTADAIKVDVRVPPDADPVEVTINRSGLPTGLSARLAHAQAFAESYHDVFRPGPVNVPLMATAALLVACLLVVWIASTRININEFSLHNFYKNRLVRCYLGASHGRRRKPNPLTGFDPADDFALSQLTPHLGYAGPQPIVNTALNLNTGSELALQERKAASFVLSPHFCGFEAQASSAGEPQKPLLVNDAFEMHGYRQTSAVHYGYSDPKGPSVGQAMAISGAAANPNSGYSTSGPMAFLLTIFDARLGWWLGNPRWKQASRRPGPSFALRYLLAELLANTTARTRFVNLSDGGHFDNLGLYELVRRRCRYIIVGDGEQDGDMTFGSLGGAIRKVRADFGVEIAIDPHPIRLKNGRSTAHCVVGTITYPELDPVEPEPMTGQNGDAGFGSVKVATSQARGWLLYLKSSLTGNEPADVIEYQSRNPEFPHQSTGDQFFSESQFESYRRLGLHVLREAFEGVQRGLPLTNLFQQLMVKWYPPIPVSTEGASRLNDRYADIIKQLSDPGLEGLVADVLTNLQGSPAWRHGTPLPQQVVYMVEQLGLMENVFFEFQFEHAANRANPRNRGWMKVFRQWVASDQFYEGLWPRVRHSYNPVFQDFIDRLRDEPIDDAPIPN